MHTPRYRSTAQCTPYSSSVPRYAHHTITHYRTLHTIRYRSTAQCPPHPIAVSTPYAIAVPHNAHHTLSQYCTLHTTHYRSTAQCTPYAIAVLHTCRAKGVQGPWYCCARSLPPYASSVPRTAFVDTASAQPCTA
eukprot:1733843-Rhodomonas_salina.7